MKQNRNFKNSKPKDRPQPKGKTLSGVITITSKGVGYVEIEGYDEEIEIQPERLHLALNGDEVEITLIRDKRSPRTQGEVTKIAKRAKTQFVGTIDTAGTRIFVIPDDRRMYKDIILRKTKERIANGTKVLVQITDWQEGKSPEGELLRIIGAKGQHNVEMEAIVLEKGFDTNYPEAVVHEAEEIERTEKPIPKEEIALRKDFRGTLTFTIDPVDAKDFDDAISYKKLGDDLYEIGVHIADVSHYVREKSALDKEAARRGCSVYLVDRTIPMLPEVLSNDICSLNPNEDKLTFSAVFKINTKGQISERWFGKTVINSDKRFTYEDAQETLNKKSGQYYEELNILNIIAKKLGEEKYAAGAIDFEKDEVKFELDSAGKPIRVYRKERLETHKLVEDYMLLANREVAEHIHRENIKHHIKEGAFIYRIHDLPDEEKLADLTIFIRALGYDLEAHNGKITSKSIKKMLGDIAGKPHESLIKTATIRSMAKAIYSTRNIGHFGLAFKHYTHFTSPIRRYPDLLVHRVLHKYLENKRLGSHESAFYENLATKSTKREILAAEAERASIKYKQVEFMQDKVGQTFMGTITGVTEWGIYIEENETKCEGMVKLRDLTDDFYTLDTKNYALIGEKTKRKFSLGDPIKFKVANADLEKKTLDYAITQ